MRVAADVHDKPRAATAALRPTLARVEAPRVPEPSRMGAPASGELGLALQAGIVTGATPSAAPRGEVVLSFGLRSAAVGLVKFWPRARVALGFAKSSEPVE